MGTTVLTVLGPRGNWDYDWRLNCGLAELDPEKFPVPFRVRLDQPNLRLNKASGSIQLRLGQDQLAPVIEIEIPSVVFLQQQRVDFHSSFDRKRSGGNEIPNYERASPLKFKVQVHIGGFALILPKPPHFKHLGVHA